MYRFSPVRSDKLDFYALSGIMETIILLLAGWGGHTGWDGGGTGVVWRDRRYQVPDRERHQCLLKGGQWKAAGGGGKRWMTPIASVLQGQELFVSEQQDSTNRMHTNPN